MILQPVTEVLSDRTEHKEDARCLVEKIGDLEKLHSGMS